MANWSELPSELLVTIAELLTTNVDYLAFRAVCASWRSATAQMPLHFPHQLPLLLLPYDENVEAYPAFSLSQNELLNLAMSASRGIRYCGSFHGWLVTVENNPAIRLVNPFTKAQIELPPVTTFEEVVRFQMTEKGGKYIIIKSLPEGFDETRVKDSEKMRDLFIKKAVASADPASTSDFIVMAIHGEYQKLAFCKYGDNSWTTIYDKWGIYKDVIYFRDRFFVVDCHGSVSTCDVNAYSEVIEIVPPYSEWLVTKQYLVDSFGELWHVLRYRGCDKKLPYRYYTVGFKIFKLDLSRGERIEVNDMGDSILFLGSNSSLCLSVRDFPGLKRNCIYFTDDEYLMKEPGVRGAYDLGIFNLKEHSFTPLPCPSPNKWGLIYPSPIWLHVPYPSSKKILEM